MNKSLILLPGAIIIAGLILAISIYLVRTNGVEAPSIGDVNAIRPVTPSDHLVGNPDAPVVVVTYTNTDCVYCKQFQRTMAQIMTEYGTTGDVAWVYRHFPLVAMFPNSGTHAEATECAASIGGSDMFWQFIDALHVAAPASLQFDPKDYGTLLPRLGLDRTEFEKCLNEGRSVRKVESDLTNGLDIGVRETPYSVILIEGAEPITISGALSYLEMGSVLDAAIKEVVR
ncbi:DsbA family protein [Patescibacteria group bacterium]|nr:DsbA family protein [Patescibacteria group bacterium]